MRNRIAIHESGHALACLVFGAKFAWLQVGHDSRYPQMAGYLQPDKDLYSDFKGNRIQAFVMLLAGQVAEKIKFGSSSTGGWQDLDNAGRIVAFNVHELPAWLKKTEQILKENWPAVEGIAKALDEKGSLSYSEAQKIFERAGGVSL